MTKKEKILICGILPPPAFGHSMMYKILLETSFVEAFDITFLNMRFWSYGKHKRVDVVKLLKLVKYFGQYVFLIITRRPRYVLYNMSFYKMPLLKDFLFCFTGRLLGCRVVIHDMGQYVRELYRSCGRIRQALLRWMLKHATACILMGDAVKKEYDGLIEPRRLFPVPASVEDTKHIVVTKESPEWAQGKLDVLYFSYMAKSKGVFTAFEAAANVLSVNDEVYFTFAGPMESETVREAYDRLSGQFPGRVRYMGYVDGVERRTALFRNADIYIFPTLRDAFGLVLLHAMAEGLPIITSIEGTIPGIIRDGENGFLIEKGDTGQLTSKILELARDPELRRRIGEANRRRYEDVYAPHHYGSRMIRAFEDIAQLP